MRIRLLALKFPANSLFRTLDECVGIWGECLRRRRNPERMPSECGRILLATSSFSTFTLWNIKPKSRVLLFGVVNGGKRRQTAHAYHSVDTAVCLIIPTHFSLRLQFWVCVSRGSLCLTSSAHRRGFKLSRLQHVLCLTPSGVVSNFHAGVILI